MTEALLDHFTPLERLNRDLKQAAETLTPSEVQYYCRRYYVIQDQRKRAASQLEAAKAVGEPNRLLVFDLQQSKKHEAQIKMAMHLHAQSTLQGRWLLSIFGVGPVIASGMLSYINLDKAPYPGHSWSFAGLVAKITWIGRAEADAWVKAHPGPAAEILPEAAAHFVKKPDVLLRDATYDFKTKQVKPLTRTSLAAAIARRPWNPAFKVLCWKAGDCFKKFSTNPKDTLYGQLYRQYKARAIAKNMAGGFGELAAKTLEIRNIQDEKTLRTYQDGKLPDGRVDAWAMRATVKIFIAHIHHVVWEITRSSPPPIPYIMAVNPTLHSQYIPPPNWPFGGQAPAPDVSDEEMD